MGEEERKAGKKSLFCPYCDEEIPDSSVTYCGACEVTIFYCPECREPVPRDNKQCPHCGAEIRG